MDLLVVGFVLAVAAGAADALGGSILLARAVSRRGLAALVALSAGFILAVTILERLPATQAALPRAGLLLVLAGYIILFAAENLFARTAHAHHHHDEHGHAHPEHHDLHGHPSDSLVGVIHPERPLITRAAGFAAYIGLGVHALFDGAAIVSGFLVDVKLGMLLFVAVMLHKVPEGLSMASITMATGADRRAAFGRAVVLGGVTALGGLLAAIVGSVDAIAAQGFLALATGSFLYVAASDLVPAANEGRSRMTLIFLLAGALLFLASEWLLGAAGFAL
ncbi:MAG TPA: ZIP family metal transporter [Candidatus Thermoplasmatota archaeon]|nr:ZIP family metal transporter [Candidatus Thermoplasmatota archaeon]